MTPVILYPGDLISFVINPQKKKFAMEIVVCKEFVNASFNRISDSEIFVFVFNSSGNFYNVSYDVIDKTDYSFERD